MRSPMLAVGLAAVLALAAPQLRAKPPSIIFSGHCASNSRVGEGNTFQDQWELSHQLARPFKCDRVMISATGSGPVWITFYSAAGKRTMPRMIFIGGASPPASREFDVIGGQAFYGVPGDANRYAWPGQVTCFIHMRTAYIATAQKIVCTAVVRRGSDEKILAAVFTALAPVTH